MPELPHPESHYHIYLLRESILRTARTGSRFFIFFPLVTCRFEAVLSPWSFGSQVGQLPLSRHLEPVESCTCRLPGGP